MRQESGTTTDGIEQQAGLSSWSEHQVVESMDRQTVGGINCPDCGQDISQTKGGQPLPDEIEAERTFGWQCDNCNNVVPCRAFNEDADAYNDKYRGIEVVFRSGHERFIPVPNRSNDRSVDTGTEQRDK